MTRRPTNLTRLYLQTESSSLLNLSQKPQNKTPTLQALQRLGGWSSEGKRVT